MSCICAWHWLWVGYSLIRISEYNQSNMNNIFSKIYEA